MAKYHINGRGEAGACRAVQGKCPFGNADEHFSTKAEATEAFSKSQQALPMGVKKKQGAREPILLAPSSLRDPDRWNTYDFKEASDMEAYDYYSNSWSSPTAVDSRRVLELVFEQSFADLPQELKDFQAEKQASWENIDLWEEDTGYYDEDPTLALPLSVREDLKKWYYAQPNAVDREGALEHVREKGFATAGLTPVEAVKKMLREENNMHVASVEKAQAVVARKISFDQLALAERHYKAVEPREPVPASPNTSSIVGVVRKSGKTLRLVDGYHRLKYSKDGDFKDGTFLVLM